MRQTRSRTVLRVEALEDRTVPSITVVFDGSKLEVTGNGAADTVEVFEAGGILFVNLVPQGSSAGLKDVVIKTNGGDDNVHVHDIDMEGTLEIVAGSGTDTVRVGDADGLIDVVVGNDIKIETNNGNDFVELLEIAAGNSVEVKTGLGNDTVVADFVLAGNDIKIETNEGNDTVIADDLVAGNTVLLDGGPGRDTLIISAGVFAGNKVEQKNFEIVNPTPPPS